jgi:hypothetical protein
MPPAEKSKTGSTQVTSTSPLKPPVPEKTFTYSTEKDIIQPVSASGEVTEGSKEKGACAQNPECDSDGHPLDEILGGDRFFDIPLDPEYTPPPLVKPSDEILEEGTALLLKITEGVENALNINSDKIVPDAGGCNSVELAADEAKKGRAARAKRKIKN